jgi:hypothetical protein
MNKSNKQIGQSTIEVAVGILITIPIICFFLNAAIMVVANQLNDNLVRNAARAAASATTNGYNNGNRALLAARSACASFRDSVIINKAGNNGLVYFDWNPPPSNLTVARVSFGSRPAGVSAATQGQVVVVTSLRVNYPIAVPYLGRSSIFQAKAIWPIVSVPPA